MQRLIFVLLAPAILVLVAYNVWQVSMLRGEVAGLKTQMAALKGNVPASGSAEGVSLIAEAREHAERARKHIADGQLKRARTELDKSLRLMQRFSETSRSSARGALERMRRTWRDAEGNVERLWRKPEKKPEARNAKGG